MNIAEPRPPRRARRLGLGLAIAGALAALALWAFSPSEQARWEAVEAAIAGKRWERAEALLARWTAEHPDDGRAWAHLGTVRGLLGRDGGASEALERVEPDDPAWTRAQLLLGGLAARRHDAAGAERAYRAVIGREPDAVEPRLRLLPLLFVQRRLVEARAVLWDLLRLTGDPRHLLTLTGQALERRQPEQFRDLGGEGDKLLRELAPFLDRAPESPWLRRARGLIRFEQGRPAEATADLEFAAVAFDDDPAVRLALADCRLAAGEPDRVDDALGDPPARPADRARWWLLRGRASQDMGRPAEAIDRWREAVAADPTCLEAQYRLGRALAREGRGDEAAPVLERAEALRDRVEALKAAVNAGLGGVADVGRRVALGRLCLELDMTAEARAWFEQAIRLDPVHTESQAALAALGEIAPESPTSPRLRDDRAEPSTASSSPSPTAPEPARPGPRFEDQAERRGMAFRYDAAAGDDRFIADTMGGGVGLIDFDGDGRLDVYFVNGCPLPVDPDRPPAPNRLFRNNDDGTFTDVTESAGVASDRWSTAAGFADLDGDGDLDLVVVTYVDADPATAPPCKDAAGRPIHCPPGRFPAQFDLIYRNEGGGTFTDVSADSGLEVPDGRGLGLAIADLDGDGRLDLFVANDAVPDFLFLNRGGLHFEEVGVAAGAAFDAAGRATASMGVAADDLDGDGLIDLFHTNFRNEPDTLLRNLGGGLFADATAAAGLGAPSLPVTGFGAVAFDGDNDGVLDLFVANGHVDDQPWIDQPMAQPPRLYLGLGDGRFAITPPGPPGPYFDRPVVGRGAAAGDLDGDGRTDLVVVHRDAPASLLRNVTPDAGHWLGVRLVGAASSPSPVGARLSCRAGRRTTVRWLTAGTGYLAASDPRLHFGLGDAATIDELEVRWPSGAIHRLSNLPADRLVVLREADAEPTSAPRP